MSGHIVSVPVDHEDIKTSLDAPDSLGKNSYKIADAENHDLEGNEVKSE